MNENLPKKRLNGLRRMKLYYLLATDNKPKVQCTMQSTERPIESK